MSKMAVLMSTYNEGKYITESIQSVLNQTYKDFTLYIYVDGSIDNTLSLIENLSHPQIRSWYSRDNMGCAYGLNYLCGKVTMDTEYVALCDSSDLYYPNKLEKQIEFANENPDVIIIGTYYEQIDLYGKHICNVCPKEIKDVDIKKGAYFADRQSGAPSMYKYSELKKVGFWNEQFKENYDTELHFKLMQIGKVETMPEILYKYRVNSSLNKNKNDVWTWYFKRNRYKLYCDLMKIPFNMNDYKEGSFGS